MSDQKVRIGIVGGGGIVRAHLPRLKECSELVDVVALSDVNAQAAETTAKEFSIPRFTTDYKEWLDEVDAVVIGVPTHLHAQIGVDCANAGKAIFMEKPFTRTREQADELIAAIEKNNVPFQVGFVRRFDAQWMGWRDLIQQEKIGKPVVWRDVQASSGPGPKWFNQDEQGGGPFIDGCIHNLDFGLYTFGPVEWVFCHGRTLREGSTAIDTGSATIRFGSGDELLLAWSWGLPGVQFRGTGSNVFEFLGPRGFLKYGEGQTYLVDNGEGAESISYPENAIGQAFNDQMDEFVAVAQGGSTPRAGWKEGLASLEVALAILESGRSGQVVRMNS